MNDNDLKYETNDENVYRATTNLNTAIENPQVNINNAMGVNLDGDVSEGYKPIFNNDLNSSDFSAEDNIQNFMLPNDKYLSDNITSENISQINNTDTVINNDIVNNDNDVISNDGKNKVNYKPTFKQKKRPKGDQSVISKEVKMMMIIISILLFVLLIIPYVYDVLKELDLVITSG